ncbi:MAG: transglycosylase [Chloroflexota bacterium]|nr:transglycosylase [Chloroflexota bacterium]
MSISLGQLIIWIIIAVIVGFIGELIARRRTPGGIIGAAVLGFLAIFLIVGVFHFSIKGEPAIYGVPLISSIIVAAILVFIWSAFAYRRIAPHATRYYRRGTYARRPRRRRRFW